jgi:hypothetical protein
MVTFIARRDWVRSWLAALAALLAGCAPLYPVQIAPTGPETFIATQTSLSSWLDARTAAMQRAAAWCARKGGQFAVTDSAQERVALPVASNDHATVAFSCKGIKQ